MPLIQGFHNLGAPLQQDDDNERFMRQQTLVGQQGNQALQAEQLRLAAAERLANLQNQGALQREGSFGDKQSAAMGMAGMNRDTQFGLADRHGANQLAVAGLQMGPSQARADLEARQYGDTRADTEFQRSLSQEAQRRLGGMIGMGGQPGAGESMAQNPQDMASLLMYLAGGAKGPSPDLAGAEFGRQVNQFRLRQMQAEEDKRKALALNEQDPTAGRAYAKEHGVALGLPTLGGSADQQWESLSQMLDQFGQQDTKMTGWDPTQEDVARLANEARMFEQRLARDYGVPPAEAAKEMRRRVAAKLAKYNDLNAGWVQALLQELGAVGAPSGAGPAALPAPGGMDMSAFPG